MTARLAVLALAAAAGCGVADGVLPVAKDLTAPRRLASVDEPFFRCRVQPIVARSCAFFRCHGDGRRFYRIYARNRLRLDKMELERNQPLTGAERQANFEFARALVDADAPMDSLFLAKPLDVRGGGRYHRGEEIFDGGDVYLSREDPEWKVLAEWVNGATFDPACVEPGSEL